MAFEYFTPLTGTLGGATIGLSAASLLLFNGDILGASGIIASVFSRPRTALTDSSSVWKLSLMGSFMVTSLLLPASLAADTRLGSDPTVPIPSAFAMTAAGLIVGIGTRLGNGCTSGHGICGLGRKSPRSLAGVMTFMATAISTIYATSPSFKPLAKFTEILRTDSTTPYDSTLGYSATLVVLAALATFPIRAILSKKTKGGDDDEKKKNEDVVVMRSDMKKVPGGTLSGALFSAGLGISGMILPSKLYGFLNISGIADGTWDPTLCCVMGAGVIVSLVSYQYVPGFALGNKSDKQLGHPVNASSWCGVPTSRSLDWKLLAGEALFGVGWAIGLLCPGPALYHLAIGDPLVTFHWMPAFLVGGAIADFIKTL